MKLVWALSVGILALFTESCESQPKAPRTDRVCFVGTLDAKGKPQFTELERDIPNVDTCGSRLEGVWLEKHQPLIGAYGGMFIWVDEDKIRAGMTWRGPRAVLVTDENRDKIDVIIKDGEKAGLNIP